MKKLVYNLPVISEKKNVIFNMFGSGANAAVSALLLIFVSRILGESGAGLFALTFPTAQMLYTVATFEVRNVQITDVKKEFSFADVFGYRILSVILMALVCGSFILWKGYGGEKALLLALFCAYMAVLAFSDAFQGLLHLNGHLDLAGKSLGYRVLSCAAGFIITLIITKNLLISAVSMIAVALLWVLFYDIPYCRNYGKLQMTMRPAVLKALFFSALPLFLSVFLQQYIFNAPKYAIDSFLSETEQSHYGFLIMPTSFINLFSIFVFRPQLVGLSKKYANNDLGAFSKTVIKLFVWIIFATIFALVAGAVLGIPVLNFLYNTTLDSYRLVLLLLLFSGGLNACSSLTITLLTVMRKQKYGLIAFGIVAFFSMFVAEYLVRKYALTGAGIAYFFEMLLLFLALIFIYCLCIYKKHKEVSMK